GLVPDIAPEYTVFQGGFRDSPEWGSACVINPWNAWTAYGDARILETAYGTMSRYAAYLAGRAEGHIVSHGLGDWYDIGPNPPGESQLTSKGLTATAVYYQDLDILARTAALLGRTEDAARFREQAEQARRAFNERFYRSAEQHYDRNSQTANAMALALGLAEPEHRAGVLGSLLSGIASNGYRVTAGDVGFSYLVRALTEAEQGETLYRMVTQDTGPGYVWQLQRGATTLTEAWDAGTHSSHNHCMLGHVEGWFYRGLGGIRADEPGFRRFILRPQMPAGLESVTVRYRSARGEIISAWKRAGGTVSWLVQVPPNTGARVYIPAAAGAEVLESGQPLSEAAGVHDPRREGGAVVLQADAGVYVFTWPDHAGAPAPEVGGVS
ncbi:MAG TPA: alpha-L-rhamnosidase C-terminal domain-containing protein, partial [Candidatus Hydrogenedentes bacterium]|nr:alpha-L-rhamnosidase C-terminal domain-containing protein [Candidatus Hydrogenedentota bacterium]